MSSEVNVSTFKDFIKQNPEWSDLDPMNQIDFSLTDINQEDLSVLKSYFADICTDLTIYMQLFSEGESIKELNKFNGFIFEHLEKAYLEKICLKISTLMDPVGAKGNENLSLHRFIKQTNSKFLDEKLNDLKDFYHSSGIKTWRNKVLAHADLKAISGKREIPINFERKDVDNFVADIQKFIDCLSDPKVSTNHRIVLSKGKDGYSFIQKLRAYNEINKV